LGLFIAWTLSSLFKIKSRTLHVGDTLDPCCQVREWHSYLVEAERQTVLNLCTRWLRIALHIRPKWHRHCILVPGDWSCPKIVMSLFDFKHRWLTSP
jgi:hypothetical protein